MKFSTTVVAAIFLGSTAFVSAPPKVSLTHVATGVGKGLSHAATFTTTARHGSIGGDDSSPEYSSGGYDSGAYRRALTKRGRTMERRKRPVHLDPKRKEAFAKLMKETLEMVQRKQHKTTGQTHKRDLDEGNDLGIFLRDLEQNIVERGWDEELEILRRDFGDLLVGREVERGVDARDFDEEFDTRDF